MPLLRFPKTVEHTHKIKIKKSLKRVDSDCFFLVLDFTFGILNVLFESPMFAANFWLFWVISYQVIFIYLPRHVISQKNCNFL